MQANNNYHAQGKFSKSYIWKIGKKGVKFDTVYQDLNAVLRDCDSSKFMDIIKHCG